MILNRKALNAGAVRIKHAEHAALVPVNLVLPVHLTQTAHVIVSARLEYLAD